ncbi:hypothetical protein RSAG8_05145, partial [Rhizoctonia solani AG-8 WAC10335]
MSHISAIRDRIRVLAASRSWTAIPRHPLCKGELDSACQFAIHAGVLANLRIDPIKCSSIRMELACTGIGGVGLYDEVRRCAIGFNLLKGGD